MAEIQININGTKYPCRLTMGALLAYKRKTGYDFGTEQPAGETPKVVDIENLLLLLGCCLESTCRADGRTLPEGFSADNLGDYINMDEAQNLWSQTEGNLQSQVKPLPR